MPICLPRAQRAVIRQPVKLRFSQRFHERPVLRFLICSKPYANPLEMVNRDERAAVIPPTNNNEASADKLIAELGGDARAAVIKLVALVGASKRDNEGLAASVSRGFTRSDFLCWP
jgi:hypothetical protein